MKEIIFPKSSAHQMRSILNDDGESEVDNFAPFRLFRHMFFSIFTGIKISQLFYLFITDQPKFYLKNSTTLIVTNSAEYH